VCCGRSPSCDRSDFSIFIPSVCSALQRKSHIRESGRAMVLALRVSSRSDGGLSLRRRSRFRSLLRRGDSRREDARIGGRALGAGPDGHEHGDFLCGCDASNRHGPACPGHPGDQQMGRPHEAGDDEEWVFERTARNQLRGGCFQPPNRSGAIREMVRICRTSVTLSSLMSRILKKCGSLEYFKEYQGFGARPRSFPQRRRAIGLLNMIAENWLRAGMIATPPASAI
jgi:hypothetical protein